MTKYESSSVNLPSLAICLDKIQYNFNKKLNIKYGFFVSKRDEIIKNLNFIFDDKKIRLKLYKNAKKKFKKFTNNNIKKLYTILE